MKLFSDLYIAKFLDISAKSFFLCESATHITNALSTIMILQILLHQRLCSSICPQPVICVAEIYVGD